jgi:hypothetical protein
MRQIVSISTLLCVFCVGAVGQQLPNDPPVASLPLPDVAVQSLSSAPGRGQASRTTATTEGANAPVRFTIVKKRPIVTPVEPNSAVHPSMTRFTPAVEAPEGQSLSLSSTKTTRFIENSPRNKESQRD